MTDYALSYIIISCLIAVLSGLFYGEKETIIRKRWQNPNTRTWADKSWFPRALRYWWESNNWYYQNPLIDTLMRYPLAMFKDGYHITGSISVMLLILAMAFAYQIENVYLLWILVGANFFFHGLGVNIAYHDWLDEL